MSLFNIMAGLRERCVGGVLLEILDVWKMGGMSHHMYLDSPL